MRIILLLLLSLLLHFSHSSSLPFNCTNTDGLTADAALESAFTTTYNRDYFVSDMNINIDVTKDGSYEASNVKGVFFSVFGVVSNGSISTSSYGDFPVVNAVGLHTVTSPCEFVTFELWPGAIDLYWKAGNSTTYPDTLRFCVGIAVTESPLTGYKDCRDIRRAEAVTKPDITSGHGTWYGPIDLHCSVTVFPPPNFNWYYNGVKIQNDYNYFLRDSPSDGEDEHKHTLTVKQASTNDTIFNYHCSVTNVLQPTEVQSDAAVLTIADLPLSLVDGPDSNLSGFLQESIVISCSFQSYPRPLIVWEKEGTTIVNSSSIVIIPTTDRMNAGGIIVESSLAFSSLSYSDSGSYACIAMRGGASAVNLDQTFTLDIIASPQITFLTPPSVAVVGTYVTLNCQASGVPTPTIKWSNSAGTEIGTTSSISVRVMNAGVNTWFCEATNAGGYDTDNTSVTGYTTTATITTPPGDSTVAYRDKASFMCETSGDPVPSVKWHFTGSDGVEVEVTADDEAYTISDSSLVIQRPTLKEQGTYRCEASNIADTVSASATLTIQLIRPAVQISPSSQEVTYNTEHTVSCVAAGLPPPALFISTPGDTKVPSPHSITSFTEVDVGLYQCVAVSPANGAVAVQSAVYSLTPLTVDVLPANYAVDITSSTSVTLTCNVQGTPTYSSISWYHKNLCSEEIVPISGLPGFSQSLNTLSIIPASVTTFLPGEYICRVVRFSQEYFATASITVSSVTDSVSFDTPLSTFSCPNLSGGQARQFDCVATSTESNPVAYTWFLNQERQDPGSDPNSLSLSSDGYGHYRCVATAGQQCEYTASDVDGGLSVGIEYNPPTPLNVEDSVTIRCDAGGFPTSAITYSWLKDGVTILDQSSSVFSIGAVTTADSGEYKCLVNLTACSGSMESPVASVTVSQSSPTISSQQNNVDIELGLNQVLSCSGIGIPTPSYQWYKNSVPIQNAESDTYSISSASTADNGLYSCELFSYVDRSFQDIAEIYIYQLPANITVTGIPSTPVAKGVTLILTCTAEGIPTPTYQWFDSNDTLLSNQAVVEVITGYDNLYRCVAVNDRGVTELPVTIPVIPDPSDLLIILPVVLVVCACFVLFLMLCSVVTMWILNFRKKGKSTKGVIAEDSNVLLEDRVTPGEDNPIVSVESSKASTPSITGVVENESVVLQGGLDRSNPLTPTQLQIVISTVAKSGGYDGDNDLNTEFESTPSNMSKWTELPKDSEVKNRYMNVLPNQDTMVELSETGESGSTYINANYITNFRSKKTGYIAAQGPLPSTIIDFWRMVWENDVSAVVMTCLLFERKRIRCARYWPDTQQRPTEIYGHFKVSIDSFAKTEDYEVSMLYLVNLKAGPNEVQKKQVYHYWYKSWPTYGVPNETNKIWKFLEELHTTLQSSNKPILFHCSAGIGRTAVFIGADMGMQEFKATGKVDPIKYLCLLRKGRGGSIQTAEQYLYLHSVLSDYITARQSVI